MIRLFLLSLLCLTAALAAEPDFPLTADSKPQEGVPKGELIKGTFAQSTIYPGTTRDYTLYIPKQLDRSDSAPLMVFQDGVVFQGPVVLDNLIHQGAIPPMLAVFASHGRVPALDSATQQDRWNRSYEYDAVSEEFVDHLHKELLPHIAQAHSVRFTKDPSARAIAGSSSGGICAFNAAWLRPDLFRRVFVNVGTFVGLRGGDELTTLVRKTEPKPLRVFLVDGSNDHNIYCGDWWMQNQMMERALTWAGYEVNHLWSEGGHNQKHATQVFPEAMRWLWKGYPAAITADAAGLGKGKWKDVIADPASTWEELFEPEKDAQSLCSSATGDVYASVPKAGEVLKFDAGTRTPTTFAQSLPGARGLALTASGELIVCAEDAKQVIALSPDGKQRRVIADGIEATDVAITHAGRIYVTDESTIYLLDGQGGKTVALGDVDDFSDIALTPDHAFLLLADHNGQFVWSAQIAADGTLAHAQRYHHLHRPVDSSSQVSGIAVDTNGWVYAGTEMGLQVCDQPGRVNAIFPVSRNLRVRDVCFGGPGLKTLFIIADGEIYTRNAKPTGVASGQQPPVKAPKPGL
jgi:gluconolactonase